MPDYFPGIDADRPSGPCRRIRVAARPRHRRQYTTGRSPRPVAARPRKTIDPAGLSHPRGCSSLLRSWQAWRRSGTSPDAHESVAPTRLQLSACRPMHPLCRVSRETDPSPSAATTGSPYRPRPVSRETRAPSQILTEAPDRILYPLLAGTCQSSETPSIPLSTPHGAAQPRTHNVNNLASSGTRWASARRSSPGRNGSARESPTSPAHLALQLLKHTF